ncbi:MAG TPA: hypothetical protein VHZ53_16780 [Steroidobacteraceae bacterium]|jgi:hypothetical protein|nr:hypothetical protein [Steroidobacteraceae bacterium]
MRLSDERLDEILDQLRLGRDASGATVEELLSIAAELRQLRLRVSSQSRSASAPKDTSASH